MNKISWYLKALLRLIRNPRLLNRVMDDDAEWQRYVARKYKLPDGLKSIDFHTILPGIHETIEPFAFLDGGSLPTDLALLRGIARSFPACRYFEIGTWRGESVANVAAVAGECYTLNLSDEQLKNLGKSGEYIAMHRFFSAGLKNVTHLSGDSHIFDFSACGKFDLVFVDGDHHFRSVKNDTLKVTEHLLNENTVVVWHDYAHDPEHVRFEVLAGILDGLPENLRPHIYHVSHTKCAILFRRPVEARQMEYPQHPGSSFRVTLETRKKI